MNLTYGSVCSGIEAVSIGWHGLGFAEPAWFSEIDKAASAVLAYRFPQVSNIGDMLEIPFQIEHGLVAAPDILVGGTPCFTGDHMVVTETGYRRIADILPGDKVVTHEGRLKPVLRVGSKIAVTGMLKAVGQGEGITCTPEHPFLSRYWRNQSTKRQGKYAKIETIGTPEWTNASDMVGRQWIALNTFAQSEVRMPLDRLNVDQLMMLVGMYIGDGWVRRTTGKRKMQILLGINDQKYAEFLQLDIPHGTSRDRNCIKVTISNTDVAEWLVDQFGEGSGNKKLPFWVYSHVKRGLVFKGHQITDGNKKGATFTFNSVSRALAYGMRDLAQTLGYIGSIGFIKTPDTTVIEGRTVNQQDYYQLRCFIACDSRKSRQIENHILRKVQSWAPAFEQTVYNIEVADDHSFVLDSAVVHNCQSFSIAGRREGMGDTRGQLTLTYVEIANAIDRVHADSGAQPCITVWENVPGCLSDKGNAFGCFIAALAGDEVAFEPGERPDTGKSSQYWTWDKKRQCHNAKWPVAGLVVGPQRTVAWIVRDAQYFGLAQRRRRVFVVASARGGFDPGAILFEPDCVRRDSPPSRKQGQDVTGTLDARTDGGGFPGTDGACAGHVVPPSRPDGNGGVDAWPADITSTLNAHFGDKQGLENQHALGGASLFVPAYRWGGSDRGMPDAGVRGLCDRRNSVDDEGAGLQGRNRSGHPNIKKVRLR